MKHKWLPKEERKTMLFLSDDMRIPSGIGTMTREIVEGTCHHYNWVQVGAAIAHPEAGDIVDLSEEKDSKTLKSELKSLYTEKDYLTACSYCNGRDYSTPKIVPAIQTKVPLPIPK